MSLGLDTLAFVMAGCTGHASTIEVAAGRHSRAGARTIAAQRPAAERTGAAGSGGVNVRLAAEPLYDSD